MFATVNTIFYVFKYKKSNVFQSRAIVSVTDLYRYLFFRGSGSRPKSENRFGSRIRTVFRIRIQIQEAAEFGSSTDSDQKQRYRYNVVVCQEPGENQRGGCQQAAVQHGLQLQGDGAQHGHHDCRIRQEGTRALLCGQVIC